MWRQVEREKEKLLQSQMSLEKKASNNCLKGVVPIKTPLDIPGEILNQDCDSNATLGEGKFDQVTLASYGGLPVAVKQFHAAVLQAKIEHEANIISSFKHLNLIVFFGVSCPEKPYLLVLEFYRGAGKAFTIEDCLQPSFWHCLTIE